LGHIVSHLGDDAGHLVADDRRQRVDVDAAVGAVQVTTADGRGRDLDHDLA
jgi:hypothetical protein